MKLNADINGKVNWVTKVKYVLQSNGIGNVQESQCVMNELLVCNTFILRLKDQYMQAWNGTVATSSKLSTYMQFKQCFVYERYLDYT